MTEHSTSPLLDLLSLPPTQFGVTRCDEQSARYEDQDGLLAHLYGAVLQVSWVCLDSTKSGSSADGPNKSAMRQEAAYMAIKSSEQQSRSASNILPNRPASHHYPDVLSWLVLWGDAILSGKELRYSPGLYQTVLELLLDCGKDVRRLFQRSLSGAEEAKDEIGHSALVALDAGSRKLTTCSRLDHQLRRSLTR